MDVENAKALADEATNSVCFVENAKALTDQTTNSVSLKRKRASQCAAHFFSVAGNKLSAHKKRRSKVFLGENHGFKKLKSGGYTLDSFRTSLVKKYTNFENSGSPQRMMLYENGAWKDVPDRLKAMARESFETRKAITKEVVFQGHRLIFDFLRMVQINLTNGLQLPLAWIDDSDVCFFPELGEDSYSCTGIDQTLSSVPNGSRQVNVHLEIDISGRNEMLIGGNESGHKTPLVQLQTQPHGDVALKGDRHDIYINNKLTTKTVFEQSCFDTSSPGLVKLAKCGKDYIIAQKMFLGGFGPHMDPNNVHAIYRSPIEDAFVRNRFKLFQKQVGKIEDCRGSACVKYGWLACSMQVAKEILNHGIADSLVSKFKEPLYGGGIVFRPSNCSQLSACDSDVDENGLHHLVLCRIVMGKMEEVSSGSEQFQPSNENFDSGVDSIKDPKLYIVWNMNVNTHVFPEYIVSFRMSLRREEIFSNGSKSGISVVTEHTAQLERTHSQLGSFSSPAKKCEEKALTNCLPKHPNLPASPWMPFPELFAAISDKITREDKNLVDQHYIEYQKKKISRKELIKHLRMVVGDKLLKSTLLSIQHKPLVLRQEQVHKVVV